jgi:uncharacterized iron-regulated membrane protein
MPSFTARVEEGDPGLHFSFFGFVTDSSNATRARSTFMRQRAYFLHRWLGIGAGLLLLVIGVTGALLVWNWELERTAHDPNGLPAGKPTPIKDCLTQIAASHPTYVIQAVEYFGKDDWLWVNLENHESHAHASVQIHPPTGYVGPLVDQTSRVRGFLLALHYQFLLGPWGILLSGVCGFALIISSLTGFYLYRGALRGLWKAPIRLGRGWRLAVSDGHKWVGVVALTFNLILGLTGLWFVWHVGVHDLVGHEHEEKPHFDVRKAASIEEMASATRQTFPDAELFGVFLPEHVGDPAFGFAIHRHGALWEKASTVHFDPEKGNVTLVQDVRQAPFSVKWDNAMHALHFGWTGATWVKVIYTFAGIAPGLLAISGVLIWQLRRKSIQSRTAVLDAP